MRRDEMASLEKPSLAVPELAKVIYLAHRVAGEIRRLRAVDLFQRSPLLLRQVSQQEAFRHRQMPHPFRHAIKK